MTTVFDFENADIGKLAIHLARARVPIAPMPVGGGTTLSGYTPYITEACLFYGMAGSDESGAANEIDAYTSPDGHGQVLGVLPLAANGDGMLWLGAPGIYAPRGVWLDATAAFTATVYVLPCSWY